MHCHSDVGEQLGEAVLEGQFSATRGTILAGKCDQFTQNVNELTDVIARPLVDLVSERNGRHRCSPQWRAPESGAPGG